MVPFTLREESFILPLFTTNALSHFFATHAYARVCRSMRSLLRIKSFWTEPLITNITFEWSTHVDSIRHTGFAITSVVCLIPFGDVIFGLGLS